MTKERVVQLVSARLRPYHPGGVDLEVDEGRVRQQNGYWYVPIRPSAEPPRMFEYYEVLAEVEEALEEQDQLQIQLVPSEPLEEAAAPVKDTSA
jgi:hypothetical protein